ncbi:MAG: hypothetical protein JSW66_15300 [Phycisphaerales bacterium]|nr:MAG: hypothetical protein JSW66_15300 [Phycisphaerales bacterium]
MNAILFKTRESEKARCGNMVLHIIFLLMVFLVPFPPAYLLYKKLPSETIVTGPFKGLNINLTGAFGGYFLLVLLALGFAYFALTPAKPSCEVWNLTGRLEIRPADPNMDTESGYVDDARIDVVPPNLKVGSSGNFTMKIIVEPGHVEGERDFPVLTFNVPGYIGSRLMLDTANPDIVFAEKTKRVRLAQPVILGRLPEETEEPRWER